MNKSMSTFKTIDDYIKSFPQEIQNTLQTLRKTIKEIAPKSQEKISYNMPAFTLSGMDVIYFAAWKKHISLYPYTSEMVAVFKKDTESYKTSGRGTIQFPLNQPLPFPLIKKIVEYRIKENLRKKINE